MRTAQQAAEKPMQDDKWKPESGKVRRVMMAHGNYVDWEIEGTRMMYCSKLTMFRRWFQTATFLGGSE